MINIFQFSHNEYQDLYEFIENISCQVAKYLNKSTINLRWYDYKKYCEDILDFKFCEYEFNTNLKNCIAGTTLYNKNGIVICCNKGMMVIERFNFSTCHEMSHGLAHIDRNENRPFMDLLYEESDEIIEREADVMASIMMINDQQIIKEFESPYVTLDYLRKEYGMSYQALEVRLKQFLYYRYGFNKKALNQIIRALKVKKPIIYFIIHQLDNYLEYAYYNGNNINSFYKFCQSKGEYRLAVIKDFAITITTQKQLIS
ncbi:MAG: ImmA/IrrE family metallo-endopeptidase [Tissierellia bacterium]|nr:ImmA/IrrE family metallo-endopeptidase [Tissierellia bacterium]